MQWLEKISSVQNHLKKGQCDGWLLYDFLEMNPLAREFLEISSEHLITRRFFYWIPKEGEPVKIVHAIELHVLDHLPGKSIIYLKWQEFEAALATILKESHIVAMEYSPRNSLPYVSKVDGGLIDLIRSFNIEVVSSASYLQYYTCILDEEQIAFHLQAAEFLSETVDKTWEIIRSSLQKDQSMDENRISEFIQNQFSEAGYIHEGRPICAVNENSANPHYAPQKATARKIEKGDFILIDLWCKKNHPKAVYADISRVAFADSKVPDRHDEIFTIVRLAQRKATEFVMSCCEKRQFPKGYEVDKVCRKVIEDAGYGPYFTHRTGHNIYTKDHGPGANIDNLETHDFRVLIPSTCFSIEPGIYLPGEFGVRLEYDILLADETVRITGGVQEEIVTLL